MKEEEYYLFNPAYRLKLDQKRVLLYFKEGGTPLDPGVSNFLGILHPIYAILLSLFDGEKTLRQVINEFMQITGVTQDVITPMLEKLLHNKKELRLSFGEHTFFFPKNTLISVTSATPKAEIQYNLNDFMIPAAQLDLKSTRLYEPFDAMLILNNVCVTQCIYCFADKRSPVQNTIPFSRLVEIIQEARTLGMRTINLSGGEVFTYPNWQKLLAELKRNHFHPHISTKYPLNQERISQLQDVGIKRIYLSLDTIDKNQMKTILRVHDHYHTLILKTLELLNKNNFEIITNGQITAINQDSMESYFDYLLQFENVKYMRVRATGFSRFVGNNTYATIRPHQDKLDKIKSLVSSLNKKHRGRVTFEFFNHPEQSEYIGCSMAERALRFNQRAQCSANFSNIQILPNGKVSICEELYYHPQFIIGDLLTHSIKEVWNSEKALSLYRLSRDSICPQSACKTCPDFVSCHQGKGVCWKLAIYAYGEDKWDFPDPRCPLSPEPLNQFWIPS